MRKYKVQLSVWTTNGEHKEIENLILELPSVELTNETKECIDKWLNENIPNVEIYDVIISYT